MKLKSFFLLTFAPAAFLFAAEKSFKDQLMFKLAAYATDANFPVITEIPDPVYDKLQNKDHATILTQRGIEEAYKVIDASKKSEDALDEVEKLLTKLKTYPTRKADDPKNQEFNDYYAKVDKSRDETKRLIREQQKNADYMKDKADRALKTIDELQKDKK